MKIILSGGGTMGSVMPLLAVAETLRRQNSDTEFLWIGTKTGPEKAVIAAERIPFLAISSGKWRRYFSGYNLLDPFKVAAGFCQSLILIIKHQPQAIIAAGGFVAVPLVWAGWLLRVPVLIHQQDIIPGLANKLMAPVAKIITVTFQESLQYYPKNKTQWIGNPVRGDILQGSTAAALKAFKLEPDLSTVLFVGGGTGAAALNELVIKTLPELLQFCQVIHVTGSGKSLVIKDQPRYHQFEFLVKPMANALAAAAVVVSRAGLGFLSECAALGKVTVIIPMPGTHQEQNAYYFAKRNAAAVLRSAEATPETLTQLIKNLLDNESDRVNLQKNIRLVVKNGASETMAKLILGLTGAGK